MGIKKVYKPVLFSIFVLGVIFVANKYGNSSISYQRIASNEEKGYFLKSDSFIENEDLSAASSRSRRSRNTQTPPVVVTSPTETRDDFSANQNIEEVGSASSSSNPKWWLNSGGRLAIKSGAGSTILGDLPSTDRWFTEYLSSNPEDTDGGLHPQNIFRLVQREKWKNFTQEVYFKISKINQSSSPNRNASNGVLLFNRYQTGDHLYYAGLRVDGAVVIKKKFKGTYYTLATKKIFTNSVYNLQLNPNLIPLNTWIGIKTEVKNLPDGTVSVKLFIDQGKTGTWTESLSTIDKTGSNGSNVLSAEGYAGIRTDFMDVLFDDYLIKSI